MFGRQYSGLDDHRRDRNSELDYDRELDRDYDVFPWNVWQYRSFQLWLHGWAIFI